MNECIFAIFVVQFQAHLIWLRYSLVNIWKICLEIFYINNFLLFYIFILFLDGPPSYFQFIIAKGFL